jgi:hypothetical protein
MGKFFIPLLAFISSFSSFGQETFPFVLDSSSGKITYRQVFEIPGKNETDIEKNIDRFLLKNKETFFRTGGLLNTKDRNWALGRMKWLNVQGDYGTFDKLHNEATGKIFYAVGNSYDRCVMFICFYGDVAIEWKNEKCRITITNLHYRHSTLGSPPGKRGLVSKRGKEGPYGAPLEYLNSNPALCAKDIPLVLEWLDKQTKEVIVEISKNMKLADKSRNDW